MAHAEFHYAVDFFRRGKTLMQAIHRLVQHRQKNAIADKTRTVPHFHRRFAQLFGQRPDGLVSRIGSLQGADQFNQRHHRGRIEKVHADDLGGSFGRTSDTGQRDGRRIRGKDGGRFGDAVEIAKNLQF